MFVLLFFKCHKVEIWNYFYKKQQQRRNCLNIKKSSRRPVNELRECGVEFFCSFKSISGFNDILHQWIEIEFLYVSFVVAVVIVIVSDVVATLNVVIFKQRSVIVDDGKIERAWQRLAGIPLLTTYSVLFKGDNTDSQVAR